jgi:starvation-inducible DNA-binding protein
MKLKSLHNDLSEAVRVKAVTLLNQQLADALDLRLQAKQAHWNVTGPHFISLHELFDSVAAATEEFTDVIAERAAQLGGVAGGTIQIIARKSRLPAYPIEAYRGADHVAALANALGQYAASVRAAAGAAEVAGDADTADIFTQVSRATDILLWKVGSHLGDGWDRPRSGALSTETASVVESLGH